LNYLCQGYKAFFMQVDRPLREMAELLKARRPPAEIMQLYPAAQKRGRHSAKKG
jgi:uncharacterized protein